MICPNCQTENDEGARFCNECGADLSGADSAMHEHLPAGRFARLGAKFIDALALVLVVFLGVGLVLVVDALVILAPIGILVIGILQVV